MLNMELSYDSEIQFLGIYPRKMEKKNFHTKHVHECS